MQHRSVEDDTSKENRRRTQRMDEKAEQYHKRYRPQMESLESHSLLSKVRPVSSYDYFALGQQLEQFENYVEMCEDAGTLSQLGRIPNVAMDVITTFYGTSPISAIASVQAIEEEQGSVYFKDFIARTSRGNVTAGQALFRADADQQTVPSGFASDRIVTTTAVVDTTTSYNIDPAGGQVPVRPFKTTVVVTGATGGPYTLKDYEGDGKLYGTVGCSGTITYTTGRVVLTFAADPDAGSIVTTYFQDFEASTDIPHASLGLRSKPISARIWTLKDTLGLETEYALRKRFGVIGDEEMANDLVAAINSEVMTQAIALLVSSLVGNTNWTKAAADGVAYKDHKDTWNDAMAAAEMVILSNAGRGGINALIAGQNAAVVIGTLDKFQKLSNATNVGPHIYGTLDGVVVVRVPNTNILGANSAIPLYKGVTPFDAALVYAPYMPLVVTSALPMPNPLLNQKAAALWAGLDMLVPNFSTLITLV